VTPFPVAVTYRDSKTYMQLRMWDGEHCPVCEGVNLRDKGSFEKCLDCGSRISIAENAL
jgi:hypothetical protein